MGIELGFDLATLLSVIVTAWVVYLKIKKQAEATRQLRIDQANDSRQLKIDQANDSREFTISKMRIEQMSEIISDFAEILGTTGDETLTYVSKVSYEITSTKPEKNGEESKKVKAEMIKKVLSMNSKIMDFCTKIENIIKIKHHLLFGVWAKKDEKDIIDDILKTVTQWKRQYVKMIIGQFNDINKAESGFDILLDNITKNVLELSQLLKAEVEKIGIEKVKANM